MADNIDRIGVELVALRTSHFLGDLKQAALSVEHFNSALRDPKTGRYETALAAIRRALVGITADAKVAEAATRSFASSLNIANTLASGRNAGLLASRGVSAGSGGGSPEGGFFAPRPFRAPDRPIGAFGAGDILSPADEAARRSTNLSKVQELQQNRLAEADKRVAEARQRLTDRYRESDAAVRSSTRSIRDQQAAFSGLNPHMAASIFYTQQVGAGFITLRGAAGLAALSLATLAKEAKDVLEASIKLETQIANVQKVMGGTDTEIAAVTANIRQLSTEIPFTTEQLADITREASRAGIAGAGGLKRFTEAIADVVTVSDIAAEQAVKDYAQIALALGEPLSRIRNMTSAVTALDQELPISTKDILAFTSRIAGSGKALKLATADVFAIAAAMSSLGIQAEAGGSAVQRTMFAMADAVSTAATGGSVELRNFASISGQTSDEFVASWGDNRAQTFIKFVAGITAEGDRASAALKSTGIESIRTIRSLITLGAQENLAQRAVETATAALEDGNLTQRRAQDVYKTTANQVVILENKFTDMKVEIGQRLMPTYREFLHLMTSQVMPLLAQHLPNALDKAGEAFAIFGASFRTGIDLMIGPSIAFKVLIQDGIVNLRRHILTQRQFQDARDNTAESSAALAEAEAELEKAIRRVNETHVTQNNLLNETSFQAAKAAAQLNTFINARDRLEASAARSQLGVFSELGIDETRAKINEVTNAIASMTSELDEISSPQAAKERVKALNAELAIQNQILPGLNDQLAALIKIDALNKRGTGTANPFEDKDGAKDAAAAISKWKQEFDSLTNSLIGGLIPALRAAASILGEGFTGSVQRAALDTTGALTDALLRQAAIIGGSYGAALVAVAQSIASVTSATRELGDVQDAQFVTAESLLGQLSSAASLLQTLALANGDTAAAATQAQAAIDKLRTQFSRLTPEQQKVAGAILDAAEALVAQAAAAGDNEDAQRVYKEGIDAAISAANDYAKSVDEMTAADKRRADASKTAAEKLAEAMAAESRANENLTKQNDRLAAAQKALAEARKSGDPVAIKAAALEAALAKEAVNRGKERVRARREETKEAEVDVAETGAAKGEGAAAADAKREELDEEAANQKKKNKLLPPSERRKLAALQAPEFFEGTVPLRLSSIPGVSSIPLRPAAFAGGNVDSSRSVVVNANYQAQPEIQIRHDLEALSMLGLV